jgi:carbonic anhydrase
MKRNNNRDYYSDESDEEFLSDEEESNTESDDEQQSRQEQQRDERRRRDRRKAKPKPGRKNTHDAKQSAMIPETLGHRWEGFTMEEAHDHALTVKAESAQRTPDEVLSALQKGNARFWTGVSAGLGSDSFQRRALIMQQYPSVAILSCSDSRVPPEVIFDLGLGEMFVIRVAGNCFDRTTTASMEYAVCHVGVKVILIMGHEGCGAIKAAAMSEQNISKEPESLCTMLKMIKYGLEEDRLSNAKDARAHDREAVVTNVKRQVEKLTQDPTIMSKIKNKELIVVGAFYEISSGIVDFFYEVSEEVDALRPGVQSRYDPNTAPKWRDASGHLHRFERTGAAVFSPKASRAGRQR